MIVLRERSDVQGLEKTQLTLGFVPLSDCAPLVVAREKGFFERQGLSVDLSREASWATVRDKVAVEALDGAQTLAAMPLAATLGLGGNRKAMVTGMTIGLNGNAIVISRELWRELDDGSGLDPMATGESLRRALDARRARGLKPPRFGVTFAYSSHNYLLRYWLAASGIDPDRDVELAVVPPPRMLRSLVDGEIDGYCVGAPFGQLAVDLGVGRFAAATYEVWNNHPEKIFSVTRSWAERHPNTHVALVMALIEACRWLDDPANRLAAARLLARSDYCDAPESILMATLGGTVQTGAGPRHIPDFHVFHRYQANFPWRSQALWTLAQMRRWGQIGPEVDVYALADAVCRPDVYRAAARRLGVASPDVDFKSEGTHRDKYMLETGEGPIELGSDIFFDGRVFDPGPHDTDPAGMPVVLNRNTKEIER